MKTQLIKSYISHNGGVNNLLVVNVMSGYLLLAQMFGKTALRRAKTWQRKFESGETPNK